MKWFFHPSLVAFLILILVCAIGVSIIQSGDMNIIDTFMSKKEDITTETFESASSPPSFDEVKTQGIPTSEYNRLASIALQIPPKTETECKGEYDACIAKGGQVSFCFPKYKVCSASASDIPVVPTNPMNIPTHTNLETIQGKQMDQQPASITPPVVSLEQLQALYKPHQEKNRKPHEKVYTISKSLRDTIRDDVALTIQKELEVMS